MKKILIMTPDIEGPVRNGGIGTAFTALATTLAKKGYDVDVLYTCGDYSESSVSKFSDWSRIYSTFGINLLRTGLIKEINIDAPYFRRKSYSIYLWLKENNIYDTVISCEWQADLYYTLLSKKNGTDFENTKFIVNTHSSTLWADEGNYQLPYDQNHLELYYMEKMVVEMADEVVSPSQYLIDWMLSKHWNVPEERHVILNCEPFQGFVTRDDVTVKINEKPASGVELVFFGRLETRKGLDIFLRALRKLSDEDKESISGVTFLGKNVTMGKTDSFTYIMNQTKNLGLAVNVISDYDRTNANEYIKRKNVLVIIPSLVENSPYTVYECLINNVNFLASNVGGIPELIPQEHHAEVLFIPTPVDLYGKIHYRLKNINIKPGLAESQDNIKEAWFVAVERKNNRAFKKIDEANSPLVSVCITHFERHHLLQQALASIKSQTYQNIEVILVDDGSTTEDSHRYLNLIENDFNSRGWKIVRSSNNYLGAARNLAARHASGEYLMFMDDDNVAKPFEVETFVTAALNSGADVLTTPSDLIFGEEFPSPFRKMTHCWLPLGPDLNIASFSNCFGDANALIRKEVFEKVGGFTEDYGLGHEDWEFFAKISLQGYKLQIVPEPLFWYRVANSGMLLSGNKSKNNYRSFRPFMDENVKYNYAMGLIPSYLEKIQELESEVNLLRSINGGHSVSNELQLLNNKVDGLISQQRDGWAHDRFNALYEAIHVQGAKRGTSLVRRVARKVKSMLK
ncbi:glycosyltransferase [Klebsiella pneumoniae]|uniref:glycosyltransferase n=1 Tax=Klebsiella pneumoniae TaxID=573 RepID=UPI0025AAC47F|nr:glycosyltransferase [Klebsiella pneumoniae]MDN0149322.1 glycosyltransferase [Klebsiella pneumoniae]